jgi:hypothetical protein
MASLHFSRFAPKERQVTLEMSLEEAAALEALLVRVGDETHREAHENTLGVFRELNYLRDEVLSSPRLAGFWPKVYNLFRSIRSPLR